MIWLAYFIYGSLVLRFIIAISNLVTGQWLKHPASKNWPGVEPAVLPLVSVLIPARNEEARIGKLLNDLIKQDYDNIEIIVYDDLSDDGTANVVKGFSEGSSKIKLLQGEQLPAGWVGKNHACHRLSLKAKGAFLLFLDADVRLRPQLIRNGIFHMHKHNLDLLSIFPKQIMNSFGEKITVPVMNWVLAGLLPLILTRISSWPSFSAANGQFMLFRTDIYCKHKFHEKLRSTIVEDINIFRKMKQSGLRTHTILSNGDISCRMYNSYRDAMEGFSRNVIEFFGGYTFVAVLFAMLTTFGFLPVIIYLPVTVSVSFIALALLHRVIISLISRQPVFENLILSPFQQIAFCNMIISALRNQTNHVITWKGRVISDHELKTRAI